MDTTTKTEVAKNEEHEKVKERIAALRKSGGLEAIDVTVLDSIEKRIAQRWPVGPVRMGILARMERDAAERAKAKAEAKPAEPAPAAADLDEDPVPTGRGRSPGKR